MAVQYSTGKAALIRAVGCIQEELNLDGESNIAVYALHPGGVLSGLQGTLTPFLAMIPVSDKLVPFDQDIKEMYPEMTTKWEGWYTMFKAKAALPGQTCVYIATGKAKEVLKGRYFDCEQDIEFVVRQGRARLEKDGLYDLKMEFIDLPNDGGTAVADWEEGNRQ